MRDKRVFALLAAVGIVAPLLAIGVGEARVGRTLERRIYDGWFNVRGPLPKPDDVAVVAIDLDSEQSLGRYPWSRDWHAHLIRNLARAGAKVVAFDATFADAFPAQDTTLRRVIDSTGVAILGAKTVVIRHGASEGYSLEEPIGVLNGAPIGIVDNFVDPVDGVIREYPVLHAYDQGTFPQLGVRAVLQYLGQPLDSAYATDDGWRVAGRRIPRGTSQGMLIDYLGPETTVPRYSYVNVVDDPETDIGEWDLDSFDDLSAEGRFQGKIVFVGSTVPEHQDLHPTPFRNPRDPDDPDAGYGWGSLLGLFQGAEQSAAVLTPGVEIHAHAAETILSGLTIAVLPRPVQYLWTFLLALVVVALAPRVRGAWGAGSVVALVGLAIGVAWWLFSRDGVWLWTATPILAVGLAYTGSTATLFLDEERQKARIRGMFAQYVDKAVVEELIKNPDLIKPGGEERVISVLFSDVADFSTISEKLSPTELVALLNEYLTAMTTVILEHGGVIDKYQGDAIMAEFGVPLPKPDHALRACRAALGMIDELARLRGQWARVGKPQLFARVGINTGQVLVGNLGSSYFSDFTVMGDHVNLASRLEGANKPYGTRLMVSEFTWHEVKAELYGRELDRIRVKGKNQPISVYEVMGRRDGGVPPEQTDLIDGFERALALYKSACFQEALAAFHELGARFPGDGPTRLYEQRCKEYIADPPPEGWDGVYTMKTK